MKTLSDGRPSLWNFEDLGKQNVTAPVWMQVLLESQHIPKHTQLAVHSLSECQGTDVVQLPV